MVLAAPARPRDSGDRNGDGSGFRVEVELLRSNGGVRSRYAAQTGLGERQQMLVVRLRDDRPQRVRGGAVHDDGRREGGSDVERRALIDVDGDGSRWPGGRLGRELEQWRAACPHRQDGVEGGRIAHVFLAGAAPGAVQPQVLSRDSGVDEDVVEGSRRGQAHRDQIALTDVGQDRLGLDVERVQHGQQQQRLGLAVAVTGGPCALRRLGHIVAAVHAIGEVADPVLDQGKSGGDPPPRIALTRADLGHFLVQRRAACDQSLCLIERGEHRGHGGPAGKAARFDRRDHLIPFGRIRRHVGLLRRRQGEIHLVPAGNVAFRSLQSNRIPLPLDFRADGPQESGARVVDLRRLGQGDGAGLDAPLQGRILHLLRIGDVQHIADPEALDLQRGREDAVHLEGLETQFAPNDVELLASLQDVDVLSVPDDVDAVNDQVAMVRLPIQRDCAHTRQHVG